MFRPLRRFKQELPKAECEDILRTATHGVLAVIGDEGYPYAVPVNHVYEDGKIYFHCAKEGHKIDAIRASDKASFCCVSRGDVMAKERTTAYISVIAFGRARITDDPEELWRIGRLIGEKFSPGFMDDINAEIKDELKNFYCVEITVEHLTGKCGREVMKERNAN